MGSRNETPISGKDVTWEMIINGVPLGINGSVTNFSEEPTFDDIETKPLGSNTVDMDRIPTGYSGTFDIAVRDGSLEKAVDAYAAAQNARLPVDVVLTSTRRYRDGSSTSHTYIKVVWSHTTEGQRGEIVTSKVTWRTGCPRVTV